MTEPIQSVRIDKWLWAVRLYKTRSLAMQACRAGHVKVEGESVKPARAVRLDETVMAKTGDVVRTVKVVGLTERRVSPKTVNQFLEDRTPAAEYEKRREKALHAPVFRPKGKGRPTKKERRAIDEIGL